MVLWRPTRPSRSNTKKSCSLHHRGLECKCRKSRDTRRNRQLWPWGRKWSKAKANRALPREHTGHRKHPLPTTQQMTPHMDITIWSWWSQINYTLFSWRWRSSIESMIKDWELTVAQLTNSLLPNSHLNLRKYRKPLCHSDMTKWKPYTVEVMNRLKGLDLIDKLPEKLWTVVSDIVQDVVIKPISRKRNARRQNGCLKRPCR